MLGKVVKFPKNHVSFNSCTGHVWELVGRTSSCAILPLKAAWLGTLLSLPDSDYDAFVTGQTLDIDHLDSLDPELYRNLLALKTYEGDVQVCEQCICFKSKFLLLITTGLCGHWLHCCGGGVWSDQDRAAEAWGWFHPSDIWEQVGYFVEASFDDLLRVNDPAPQDRVHPPCGWL